MTPEAYCAERIRLMEGEEFLAVGEDVARKLNSEYEKERRAGVARRLPDLLSAKREGQTSVFRLREVKFKLLEPIVRHALDQLRSGARHLLRQEGATIDRLEIVVPLGKRNLKEVERAFLGREAGPSRYRLRLDGAAVSVRVRSMRHPVTVLVL